MTLHWSDAYIGIPYAPLGKANDGVDCWGLAHLVYRDVLHVDLPDFDVTWREEGDEAGIARVVEAQKRLGEWFEIDPDSAEQFDILVMRWRGLETHIGIVCGGGLMLHAMSGRDSEKTRISEWRFRTAGAYRHWSRS